MKARLKSYFCEKLFLMKYKNTPVSINVKNIINELKDQPQWLNQRTLFEGITIDGDESRDLDDAIWIEQIPSGWKVDVAISDLAQCIEPNSPLFEKARGRQVSEYLSTGVKNMLPRILSEGFLSLNNSGEKPVLLFSIELSQQLETQKFQIDQARFRSIRKLTYVQTANILNNNLTDDPLYGMLSLASQLAQMLVQKRRDRGALAFYDLTKGYITNENGQLERIKKKETTLAYLIVQEIMILANTNIAKFFAQKEIPFIFRNHSMKAATPKRETLMGQYLVAQTDANAFEMLNNRLQILSNPAVYETVLNGHYGLNETAYAHITSPIRRFADLVNHYQIKCYLNKTEPFFTTDVLNRFCDEINTGNAYRRDVKAEYFESKAQKLLAKKAGSMSYGNLIEIPINEFRKILKAGAKLGKMRPELEQACQWRIKQEHFTSIDFYLLLKMANEGKMSHELKNAVEMALLQNPGASSQIIQFLQKEGFFSQIEKEITEAPAGGFLARYIGSYTESPTIISTPTYTWEQNKRDALNKAADNWVQAFFNNNFIDAKLSKKPAKALIPAAVKNIEDLALSKENYYGKLLEIVQKENSITALEESFIHEGTPHQPVFHYSIPLTINEQTQTFKSEGSTKKLAKQKAAKLAIEYLNQNCLSLNNTDTEPNNPNQLLNSSNYTSILQIMLQQNPQNTFKFEHEDLGQQNTENRFSTLLTITMSNQEYSFNSNAPSKKEGKKATAKMALDQLFNNLKLS